MVDCTLCSLMSFMCGCIYNFLMCALEYPIVVFALSFLIAIVFVSNLHSAKLMCESADTCTARVVAPTDCRPAVAICDKTATGCTDNTPVKAAIPAASNSQNFDYGSEHGPHTWCCDESNQSPINIIDSCVEKLPIRELLTWNHFDDLPNGIMLENNGHTVILRACYSGNVPTISGADLLACYTFVELCFRWSAWNDEGSEHMIHHRKYPLEVQVMNRTGPKGSCTSSYDLLMIAYFFEISTHNHYLDPICQNLYRIQKPGTKIEIPPFPLAYLCHQFRTHFYSYGGSLTEPPCYQGAEWFVYPEPMAISEQQLNEFRQLLSTDGKTRITNNARPVQKLCNGRVINLNQYNPIDSCCMEAPVCEPPPDDECFD